MSKKGPFGLWMGMIKSDFDQPLTELAPCKFQAKTVSHPHPAFANYIVHISPRAGLFLVKATGKPIVASPDGAELKSAFEVMEKKLSTIYGKQKKIDTLFDESHWAAPEDWMQSVFSKERFLASEWSRETGASIDESYSSITLSICVDNVYAGYIALEYSFKNFAIAQAEILALEDVVLRVNMSTPNLPPANKDAWEDWDTEQYAPGMRERKLEGVRLNIKFMDRAGQITRRDVDVQKYAHNPGNHAGVIYAFCHLRQARRPFAFSRIQQATDLSTGKTIPDIGTFLDNAYQATPLYTVEQFLQEQDAAMYVLFSFAKADGAMRAKERSIILQWAKTQGMSEPAAIAELETQIRGWYMTRGGFWNAVKMVKTQNQSAEYMQALWASINTMMSKKTLHTQEEQFLSYVARQWGFKEAKQKTLSVKS
jgi:hypothetical protein